MLRDRTSSHLYAQDGARAAGLQSGVASLTALGWLGNLPFAIVDILYVSNKYGNLLMGGLILESPLIATSMVSS